MKASIFRVFSSDRILLASPGEKKPPHHGAFARLNCHLIPLLDRCSCTSSSSNRLTKVFSEAWKVFALSETISFGRPRRLINLLRQSKNVGASRLETNSKCTDSKCTEQCTPLSSLGHPWPLILRTKDQRSQLLHSWKRAHPWLEILENRAILELDSSGLEIFDVHYIRTVPSSQFVSPLGSSSLNELLLKFPLNHCAWHVRDTSEWSMTWHGDSVKKAREILCHMMLGCCQVVLCNKLCLSCPWTVQVASRVHLLANVLASPLSTRFRLPVFH